MTKMMLSAARQIGVFALAAAALWFVLTDPEIMGRRIAAHIKYFATPKYWSDQTSVCLWHVVVAWSAARALANDSIRTAIRRRLRRAPIRFARRIPSRRYALCALATVATSLAIVLTPRFVDVKGAARFLRFQFAEAAATISVAAAIAALLAAIILRTVKKKKGSVALKIALLIATLGARASETPARDDQARARGEKTIKIVKRAEQNFARSLDEISETPALKHWDGGYQVDDAILQCFSEASFRFTGGTLRDAEILFRLHEPQIIKANKKYPLLIWFHGYGESVGDNKRHLAHLHRAIKSFAGEQAPEFYMLAVQCPRDKPGWTQSTGVDADGKDDSPMTIVGDAMARLLEEYPIDPDRVGVIGISSGARAAWLFASERRDAISSLVAFSGEPPLRGRASDFVEIATWTFNNSGDDQAPPDRSLAFAREINALGGVARATVYSRGGHNAWTAALQDGSALAWALSQKRGGVGRLQEGSYPERSALETTAKIYLPTALLCVLFLTRKDRTAVARERRATLRRFKS